MAAVNMECSICTNDYDATAAHRPLVGRCGHSICASCVPSLNNNKCPSCQMDGSFANKAVNFQLIEYLESAAPLRDAHEAQVLELQSQVETVTAMMDNTAQVMAINVASEEQLQMELQVKCVLINQMEDDREQNDKIMLERIEKMNRELEEKNKRIEELEKKKKNHRVMDDTISLKPWNCSSCHESMDQSKARICVDCGKKDGVIRDRAAGGYCIEDMHQADARMLCANCCLDTVHEEHASRPYLLMKLTHRSNADIAELISLIQRVGVTRIRRADEGLLEAMNSILPILEKIRMKASTQKSELEYNRMMAKCGSIKRVIDGIARDHEEMCERMIEDVKQNTVSRLQLLCQDEIKETAVLVDTEDEEWSN